MKSLLGWLKKESPQEKKMKAYRLLMEKAYKASHTNRTEADRLTAEADALLKEIEKE